MGVGVEIGSSRWSERETSQAREKVKENQRQADRERAGVQEKERQKHRDKTKRQTAREREKNMKREEKKREETEQLDTSGVGAWSEGVERQDNSETNSGSTFK